MQNTDDAPAVQDLIVGRQRHRAELDLEGAVIPATHRAIDPRRVDELAQSMEQLGLFHPVVVYHDADSGDIEVVAGGHRVQAARSLGWSFIDAVWIYDKTEARLITITENLHRAELTALERDEQIAEWIELTTQKLQSSQVATNESKREDGRGHRPESGVRAAARELGVSKDDAHRAVKVALLSPEAKDEARALGLDDNRSALLDAAKYQEPKDQVAALLATHDAKTILAAGSELRAEKAKTRHAERTAKIIELSRFNAPLVSDRKYPVLLADPPWAFEVYDEESGSARAAGSHYPTMPLDKICEMPVQDLAADSAVLFMWTTAPHLKESFQVLDAWGFEYVTNVAWVKDKIGLGYWVRNQHELLLICRRGAIPAPLPANRPPSVIEAPRREHSRKPDEAYELIERMYPDLPKIELFARQAREGWAAWGNQVPVVETEAA